MKYLLYTLFITICLTSACNKSVKQLNSISDKTIYEVVFRENLAGSYEKWGTGDNAFEYYYTYADRGRGPENSEKITLNEQNYITAQSITGVNYLNSPVN